MKCPLRIKAYRASAKTAGSLLSSADSSYEILFLAAYGMWLAAQIVSCSFLGALGSFDGLLRYAGIAGALLAYFLSGRWKWIDLFAAAVLVVVLVVAANTGVSSLMDLIIFIYSGRFIDFNRIVKVSFWVSVLSLAMVVLLAECGYIENFRTLSEFGREREYLGFLYALQPAQVMFNIACLACYSKKSRLSLPLAIALLVAIIWIYQKTDSRLSTGIAAAIVLCTFILRFEAGQRILGSVLKVLAPVSFVLCFVVSWFMVSQFSSANAFYAGVNHLLEGRLYWAQCALFQYGTTLFGQQITFVGSGLSMTGEAANAAAYNYVDMLFIKLPIEYGWLFTILVLVAFSWVLFAAAKKSDYWLLLVLAAIAAHCLVDDLAIQLQFNTFLFLIGVFLVRTGLHGNKCIHVGEDRRKNCTAAGRKLG